MLPLALEHLTQHRMQDAAVAVVLALDRRIDAARRDELHVAAFLGRDGGKARGTCDVELIVPAQKSHRIQEGHKILYHSLCEWVDQRVD